jgi:hypothetical protein
MAATVYGYRDGERCPVRAKVDSASAAINTGDFLTRGSAGYVQQAGAGDNVVGVAMESVAAPSSDGLATVLMDVSPLSLYEYPGASAAAQAKCNLTCDIGGAQAIDEAASADDVIQIHEVTPGGNYLISILPHRSGVA